LWGHGFLDLRINTTDDIANRLCADQILFPDLDTELCFQVHDEFEAIKAADAEVINKQRFIPDPLKINHESFRQYRSDFATGIQWTSSLRLP
jgi:hypothetical protein